MSPSVSAVCYIAATILFILSLGGLSSPESSRRGNLYGMIGMAIAVIATVFGPRVTPGALGWIAGALAIGAVIGLYLARTVKMTQMPELVAFMHSLVGLVAMLVGYASFIDPSAAAVMSGPEVAIHHGEIYVGVLIGAVTLSGSVIAFGKLSGRIGGKPLLLPARHWLNLVGLLAVIYFGCAFLQAHSIHDGMRPLVVMSVIALLFGVHMVMAIGGADMPVVVSMLNSYSGWAAAATGFMLSNDLLIVTGALVGSSGAILSYIMCRAMNRKFLAVIAGGFGGGSPAPSKASGAAQPAGRGGLHQREGDGGPAAGSQEHRHRARLRHGRRAGAAHRVRDHQEAARHGQERALRDPPGGGPHARPHERAARRGEGALRHRARDGRDQRGPSRHRRRDGHRRQRHREPERAGRSVEPDRRHARARGVEGEDLDRHEAQHGVGLRRRGQPALLQGEQPDVVRRREEDAGRSPGGIERMNMALSKFPVTSKWPPKHPERIQLYSLPTPNGVKVSIALEELGLAYEPHLVSFDRNDQTSPEFLSLSPNNKIPAIIDPNGPWGRPLPLFESGAILFYLSEKTGKLVPNAAAARYETLQWVMFQMGGIGPMFGQVGFFVKFAGKDFEDKRPRDRYVAEAKRLLAVLDKRLAGRDWIMGDEYTIADIATFPWVRNLVGFYGAGELVDFESYAEVKRVLDAFVERPAVKAGLDIPRRE